MLRCKIDAYRSLMSWSYFLSQKRSINGSDTVPPMDKESLSCGWEGAYDFNNKATCRLKSCLWEKTKKVVLVKDGLQLKNESFNGKFSSCSIQNRNTCSVVDITIMTITVLLHFYEACGNNSWLYSVFTPSRNDKGCLLPFKTVSSGN